MENADRPKDEPCRAAASSGGALNTMTKMRRDQPANLAIPDRICGVLHCEFADIVERTHEAADR